MRCSSSVGSKSNHQNRNVTCLPYGRRKARSGQKIRSRSPFRPRRCLRAGVLNRFPVGDRGDQLLQQNLVFDRAFGRLFEQGDTGRYRQAMKSSISSPAQLRTFALNNIQP